VRNTTQQRTGALAGGGFETALVVGLHVQNTSILGLALFSMVLL
jgi:hypothetical protein